MLTPCTEMAAVAPAARKRLQLYESNRSLSIDMFVLTLATAVAQTKQRLYDKDTSFSYYPFMPILGTGLVTANGALWRAQRLLISPALRNEMLDEVHPPSRGRKP